MPLDVYHSVLLWGIRRHWIPTVFICSTTWDFPRLVSSTQGTGQAKSSIVTTELPLLVGSSAFRFELDPVSALEALHDRAASWAGSLA